MRSSDKDRTLMAAQATLAGLFPVNEEESAKIRRLNPIPIHTMPYEQDQVKNFCGKNFL